MRPFNQLSVICLAGILASGVVLPIAEAQSLSAPALEKLGLEIRWTSQATLNVQRDTVAHVANDENVVYVQSTEGIVTAFDAENGRRLWSQRTSLRPEPAFAVVSNERIAVVCVGPVVYGFDKFTGDKVIEHRVRHLPTASPFMTEGVFYLPVAGGAIYAYSTAVLEYEYRYGELPDGVARPFRWRFVCGDNIVFPPVAGAEALAFVTEAKNLHSINTSGLAVGKSRFQLILNDKATAPLGIGENNTSASVLMLTGDNRVFSVDIMTGQTEWTYPMGRPMRQKPAVIRDRVFVTTTDGYLTQFSRDKSSVDYGRPIEIPQYKSPMYIGAAMTVVNLSQPIQTELEVPSAGVRLKTIVADSPAAMAGLQAGDVITGIQGQPIDSLETAKEVLAGMRLRTEIPFTIVRTDVGLKLEEAREQGRVVEIVVEDVGRQSPADRAGVQPGDVVVSVGGVPAESRQQVLLAIAETEIGQSIELGLLREGTQKTVSIPLDVYRDGTGAVSRITRRVVIPIRKWDVPGIDGLSAVGRFSVFGIDQASRLVAFDRERADVRGRVSVLDFDVRLHNDVTDQVYLFSSSGEVVCLREIGPTVRVPDLGPSDYFATVKSLKVQPGDPIEPTGTVVCELELADGTTLDVSSSDKGVVRRIHVREGQRVAVNDPLILIFDDKFATYHRRPQQQPVDVTIDDGKTPPPANDDADNLQ